MYNVNSTYRIAVYFIKCLEMEFILVIKGTSIFLIWTAKPETFKVHWKCLNICCTNCLLGHIDKFQAYKWGQNITWNIRFCLSRDLQMLTLTKEFYLSCKKFDALNHSFWILRGCRKKVGCWERICMNGAYFDLNVDVRRINKFWRLCKGIDRMSKIWYITEWRKRKWEQFFGITLERMVRYENRD